MLGVVGSIGIAFFPKVPRLLGGQPSLFGLASLGKIFAIALGPARALGRDGAEPRERGLARPADGASWGRLASSAPEPSRSSRPG